MKCGNWGVDLHCSGFEDILSHRGGLLFGCCLVRMSFIEEGRWILRELRAHFGKALVTGYWTEFIAFGNAFLISGNAPSWLPPVINLAHSVSISHSHSKTKPNSDLVSSQLSGKLDQKVSELGTRSSLALSIVGYVECVSTCGRDSHCDKGLTQNDTGLTPNDTGLTQNDTGLTQTDTGLTQGAGSGISRGTGTKGRSIAAACAGTGLPEDIVDCRHQIVHKTMPSCEALLRSAANCLRHANALFFDNVAELQGKKTSTAAPTGQVSHTQVCGDREGSVFADSVAREAAAISREGKESDKKQANAAVRKLIDGTAEFHVSACALSRPYPSYLRKRENGESEGETETETETPLSRLFQELLGSNDEKDRQMSLTIVNKLPISLIQRSLACSRLHRRPGVKAFVEGGAELRPHVRKYFKRIKAPLHHRSDSSEIP